MDPPAPPDEVTDASLGSVANTVDHDENTEPILRKILEELAGDDSTKGEAESLDDWIARNEGTRQGLEMKDFYGRTPLHVAAARGLSAAATKLVRAGATLNAQDQDGETPLYAACYNGHEDIVELLLGAGADTTISTKEEKETPLFVAAAIGNEAIVKLLVDKSRDSLNFQSRNYKWTPLHVAARDGHEAILKYLRAEGSRLDLPDEDGWTPLWTAVECKRTGAVKVLLEKKEENEDLQLEAEDSEHRTPLLKAAESGFWEGARLLINKGAKCDTPESIDAIRPNTALHLAVSANQFEIVHLLLKGSANVNTRNNDGQHCSHLASLQGNKGILELLLSTENFEGLDARDNDGMTPLHLACIADKSDDDGSDDDESNADEPDDDKQEIRDVAVNSRTGDKVPTSQPGRYDQVIDLLLERKADTATATNDDKTALELAFDFRHSERGEAILKSLEITSPQFSRALSWAARNTNRHTIATSLLKRQSDGQLEGQNKQSAALMPNTAIEWAAYTVNPDALWLLIASSSRSRETTDALNCAKKLLKNRAQPTEPKNQKHDGLDNTKKRNRVPPKAKEDLVWDIINNPPTGLICSDSQEYSTPSTEEKESLDKYTAAIVQFREQQGRIGSIFKSQNVKKTIYTEGPKRIIDGAVSKLEEQAKKLVEGKGNQGSTAFKSINSGKSKFTWVHLPATNMTWMEDLLQRIMKDQERPPSEFNLAKAFFKDSWIQVPDKVSPSRIMRPRFVWRDTNGSGNKIENPSKNEPDEQDSGGSLNRDGTAAPGVSAPPVAAPSTVATAAPSVAATAIYMPYLSYSFQISDKYQYRKVEEEKAEKPSEPYDKPDTRFTEAKEPKSETPIIATQKAVQLDEEKKGIKYANGLIETRDQYRALFTAYKDKIVHGSSTLDESYYHFAGDAVEDKRRRNESQVATKVWLKGQKLGSYWPLIRVNQLWIWTIDDKWLISASSHSIDDHENELLDGVLDLLEKQAEAGGSDLQPSSASEMSQFIIDYCVESYERKPRETDEDRPTSCKLENFLSIRQAFSESINSIARGETELFDKLQAFTKRMRTVSSLNEQSEDALGYSLDEQLKDATIQAEELSKAAKDILDELNMLESTAYYQQDVQKSIKAMRAMKKQGRQSTKNEMKNDKIPETDLTATYVINDIKRLDSVAKRVLDAVNTTLSLQQSEVANLQAKLSLQQANDSAKQGRVLMVFTVVTIVFLPLSFLTSFFALDISSFRPEAWATSVIFSVTIAVSIPTIIAAFTWEQSKRFLFKHTEPLLLPVVRSYLMFNSNVRKLVLTWNTKKIINIGSNTDGGGTGRSLRGASQSRASHTVTDRTVEQQQTNRNGLDTDLEKGLDNDDGSKPEGQTNFSLVNSQAV